MVEDNERTAGDADPSGQVGLIQTRNPESEAKNGEIELLLWFLVGILIGDGCGASESAFSSNEEATRGEELRWWPGIGDGAPPPTSELEQWP